MKLATFNINGINQRLESLLKRLKAKQSRHRMPAAFQGLGNTKMNASLVLLLSALVCACGSPKSPATPADTTPKTASQRVLNLFIWSDYLAPDTLKDFETQTGIKVRASYYDSNEVLETRLLAGASGFDLVVPSADYFERQIKAGAYLKLDMQKLPNAKYLDAKLMASVAPHDPSNAHGVIYMWATNGLGLNRKAIRALLPQVPLDSWGVVFDPAVASQIAKCGIGLVDSPVDVERAALLYLGRDPNSQDPSDVRAAFDMLNSIRRYIRSINSSDYIEALANGELCVALGYNGDILQARDRAHEARTGIDVEYVVPKEGSVLSFDMLAIPKDAPNQASAYEFMNYLMNPRVIADISNVRHFANANTGALPLLNVSVREDPSIYPPPDTLRRLVIIRPDNAELSRLITREWQRFKTGE